MADDVAQHDRRSRRCPRLGHPVEFSYCRQCGNELPCSRIADCWWETFDVVAFLRGQYTEAQLEALLAPPKPKIASLVELIQQAQQRAKQSGE